MTAAEKAALEWRPATAERWAELETLFGARGACAGCWCMWWRENAAEWKARKGEGNRQALRALVEAGAVPGLLAYRAGVPVGWVSVGPREDFPRICASKALASVGGEGVWSVVCFYVAARSRRQGVSEFLLRAALDHARLRGAKVLEAYPVEPAKDKVSPVSLYTGMASTFARLGFVEVARPEPTRPIMRYAF